MFGFRSNESPVVQLYGKLPLAKDYLRLGFSDGPALAVRDWLDNTYSGSSRDGTPEVAFPACFVIGDAWRTCMQLVVAPSSDNGGLRPFPFAIGVDRRRRAIVEDLAGGGAKTTAVFRWLSALRDRCAAMPDGRTLLAAQRGVEVEIRSLAGEPEPGVDVDAWLQGLWPDRGREGLEADLGQLVAAAGSDAGCPIRLPLLAGCSQVQQVLAWLEILDRIGVVSAKDCPTVFFPAQAADDTVPAACRGFLTVFRSPPVVAHGWWLAPAAADQALGRSDLAGGRSDASPALPPQPATEGLPPLAASLRVIVAAFARRTAGGAGH